MINSRPILPGQFTTSVTNVLVGVCTCIAITACSQSANLDARTAHAEQPLEPLVSRNSSETLHHQKPGAKIWFSHDLNGKTGAANTWSGNLLFEHAYTGGEVTVTLDPDPAVSIVSPGLSNTYGLEDRMQLAIPISLHAMQEGKHYVRVLTEVRWAPDQVDSRVFAFFVRSQQALEVSDQDRNGSKLLDSSESREGKYVVLPAQEEIYPH